MFEQLCMFEHCPYLLPAKNDGELFNTGYSRKMQEVIRQTFSFQQEAKAINGVFKISLRWCMAALLQPVQIIFDLFGIKLGRQALKIQSDSSYMTTVIIKGARAAAQDGNIAFKALQQFCKSINFTTGTIEIFIPSQFFRRFFFVVII